MTIDQSLIDFANHLADISEEIVKKYFRKNSLEEIKTDFSPVTMADKEIEKIIRSEISNKYPSHGIIGEEFNNINLDADYKWIIDPIDGTISFAIGKPIFGTLIALAYKNKPIIGIINQPINNERWLGIKNDKSYFNNKIIETKNCQSLADAIFCTQSPFFFQGKIEQKIKEISSQTKYQHQGGVIYSGDCYHFGLLASGFVDIVIEQGLNNFDYMALVPIVESAKGIITDWNGNNLDINSDGKIIACSSLKLHQLTLRLLND